MIVWGPSQHVAQFRLGFGAQQLMDLLHHSCAALRVESKASFSYARAKSRDGRACLGASSLSGVLDSTHSRLLTALALIGVRGNVAHGLFC